MPSDGEYADFREVWCWPEFQAFAARLGIETQKLPTRKLTIIMEMDGEPVRVVQEYLGENVKGSGCHLPKSQT